MPYVGNVPAEQYASFEVQHFTTSATTSYTLTHAVANELDIRLVLNNVIQQPGSGKAYTAAATTLTLSGATTSSDTMYAVYIGKAVQTVVPPDGSVSESKLQVSNSPTNGQVLSAQSGAAGGLTWAADAAGTVTGYTNGVDNRVITSSGTTTLNGEANLTYDGTQLVLTDGTEGTDNLLVKTTADGSISMAVEKSDLKYDLGLDHNNDGSKNFFIRERTKDGVTTNSLRLIIDEAGAVTKPLQPAFNANASSAQNGLGATTWITGEFDTEIFDVNADYDNGTYIFTAPVTGKYLFTVMWTVERFSGRPYSMFNTSNRNYTLSYFGNDLSGGADSFTGSVIADMDASDTCKWRIYAYDDSDWDLQCYNFSGTLLC